MGIPHSISSVYRDIFDNATIGIFQTSPDGYYIRVNPALARIYGYESPDQMLKELTDISGQLYVHSERRQEFAQAMNAQGFVENFESPIRRADGQVIWISEDARVVKDSAGNALYYEGFVKDVTDNKRLMAEVEALTHTLESRVEHRTRELEIENERRRLAESALTEALYEAKSALETKSRFLAGVSHELRTPLNAIIGFSEVMATETLGPVGNEKYVGYVDHILNSGRHLLSLINDILDLSKIDAGRMDLNVSPVNLSDVLSGCVSMLESQIRDGGLTLEAACDDTAMIIEADGLRLRQVFLNLLSNAIKFTPDGGTIALTCVPYRDTGYIVTVRDTGVGMKAEDIPKALSEYGQVEHGLDHVLEGTGLGLPISKKLVEMHGGRLILDSEPGVGTTVTVKLPKACEECSFVGQAVGKGRPMLKE